LETQLQQALEVGNTASRRTEILYEENIRLSRGYVELREKCDQELRAVREQHEALQQQSNELRHNIAVERIQLKVAEEAALIKAQQETRDELAKLLDQRLEITQEKKLLEEALMDSKAQLWKMEGECRTLESRIARKDRELGDAIAEMKLLKLKYIRAPSADASVQTERSATAEMFTRAVGTPRAPAAEGDASPIEALRRAAILEQEVEHLRETHRVLLAQHEAVIIQRHEAEMEAKQARQVIMSLQAKKTRLEEAVRRLELRELSHHSPRGKSSFGSPLGNESNQQGVAELQEAEAGLREQLSSTEAENKRLKREIADLRSLLSVHLSSPARRPALRK
jgi:chromosome segregation ATPase